MKKVLSYLTIAAVAVGMFTSCGEETTDVLGPEITFKAGDGLTTGDETVKQGESVSFSWEVNKGDASLASFTVRKGALDMTDFPKTDIDKDQYEDELTDVLTEVGTVVYTFIAEDKDGEKATKTINITVESPDEPAGAIKSHVITLGAQGAAAGSCYASITGEVYGSATAVDNASKIDLGYFYGATNEATLAAPSDSDMPTMLSYTSKFAVKNSTVIAKVTADFDAITDDTGFEALAEGVTASKANKLAKDDVVVFKTAATSDNASKIGVAKVTALSVGNDGSITLSVKVQE